MQFLKKIKENRHKTQCFGGSILTHSPQKRYNKAWHKTVHHIGYKKALYVVQDVAKVKGEMVCSKPIPCGARLKALDILISFPGSNFICVVCYFGMHSESLLCGYKGRLQRDLRLISWFSRHLRCQIRRRNFVWTCYFNLEPICRTVIFLSHISILSNFK